MNRSGVFILSALLVAVTASPFHSVVDVTEDTLGNYRFAFDSGDYSKLEERLEDGLTKGKYTFVDPDGVKHTVEYSGAAEQGIIAVGDDIPAEIQDTLENIQARDEHLAVFSAVENDPRFRESPADEDESPISGDEYLAALHEQLHPNVPFVFQPDTPEIAAAKEEIASAHRTAVEQH